MTSFQYGFFDELAKLASDVPGQRIDAAYQKTLLGQAKVKADSSKTVANIRARQEASLAREHAARRAAANDMGPYGEHQHYAPLDWV